MIVFYAFTERYYVIFSYTEKVYYMNLRNL